MTAQSGRSGAGLLLIGIGGLFFLSQIFGFSPFGMIWPFFIILPGAIFLYAAYTGDKKKAGFAVPGAIITGTGAILLYQNITDHWASWAYAWTLYPVFLGMALSFMGKRTGETNTYQTGQGFIRWGGLAFIVAAAFFELVVFDHGAFGNLLLPMVLIGAGAWMLMRGGKQSEKRKVSASVFTGNGTKAKNGHSPVIDERLQQQIDEALAEDDPTPSVN